MSIDSISSQETEETLFLFSYEHPPSNWDSRSTCHLSPSSNRSKHYQVMQIFLNPLERNSSTHKFVPSVILLKGNKEQNLSDPPYSHQEIALDVVKGVAAAANREYENELSSGDEVDYEPDPFECASSYGLEQR